MALLLSSSASTSVSRAPKSSSTERNLAAHDKHNQKLWNYLFRSENLFERFEPQNCHHHVFGN